MSSEDEQLQDTDITYSSEHTKQAGTTNTPDSLPTSILAIMFYWSYLEVYHEI